MSSLSDSAGVCSRQPVFRRTKSKEKKQKFETGSVKKG